MGGQRAEVPTLDDESRVLETDDRDERADADADRELQIEWDRVDDPFPQPEDDERDDDDAVDHEDAHHRRPIDAVRGDFRGGVGVQAEARGERERVAAEDAHRDRQ